MVKTVRLSNHILVKLKSNGKNKLVNCGCISSKIYPTYRVGLNEQKVAPCRVLFRSVFRMAIFATVSETFGKTERAKFLFTFVKCAIAVLL